jgi:hypothetical protein
MQEEHPVIGQILRPDPPVLQKLDQVDARGAIVRVTFYPANILGLDLIH